MQKQIRTPLLFLVTSMLILTGWLGITNAQEINTECKGVYLDVSMDNKMCPYTEYLYHQEVASGSNGNFMPDEGINRGQVAKIIMNAFQIPEDLSGDEFPDVSSSHTFYKHIMSLKNAGVLSGYPDGEFKPDNEVTRAQMMKLVINAMNDSKPDTILVDMINTEEIKFSDIDVNHSLVMYVQSAYISSENEGDTTKIIKGYPDGTFKPDQSMKRAEVAKVVTNSMKFGEFENVSCEEWFCGDLGNIFLENNIIIAERMKSGWEYNKLKVTEYKGFKLVEENIIDLTDTIEGSRWESAPQVWQHPAPNDPETMDVVFDDKKGNIYFFVTARSTDEGCNSFDMCSFNVLQRLMVYNKNTKEIVKVHDFVDYDNTASFLRKIIENKEMFIHNNKLYYWRTNFDSYTSVFSADNTMFLESFDLGTRITNTYFETSNLDSIQVLYKKSEKPQVLIVDHQGLEGDRYFDVKNEEFIEKKAVNSDIEDEHGEFVQANKYFSLNDIGNVLLGFNEDYLLSIYIAYDTRSKLIHTSHTIETVPLQSFNRFYSFYSSKDRTPPNEKFYPMEEEIVTYDFGILDVATGQKVRDIRYDSLKVDVENYYSMVGKNSLSLWLD